MAVSTATVTWISHRNFGTYLQAYALQHVLKGNGFSNKVLNDSSVVASFSSKRFSPIGFLKGCTWLFPRYAAFRDGQDQAIKEYEDFKLRFIDVDSDWKSPVELSSRYDVFIAGSDQIWSPNVPFDDFYYLAFATEKKVAYAPSFGTTVFTEHFVETLRPLIKDFDAITVREPAAALMLKERFGLDVPVVADPTMLLDSSDWDAILEEEVCATASSERYALCYFLTYNEKYVKYVSSYCRRNGLKLKILVVNERMAGLADEDVYAGPLSFIRTVKRAEIVFTDSYHGSIFSVLYNRNLLVFKRFRADSHINQNSRVEHLMHKLGLETRLVDESSLSDKWTEVGIDYLRVGSVVDEFRRYSLQILKSMLEQ